MGFAAATENPGFPRRNEAIFNES